MSTQPSYAMLIVAIFTVIYANPTWANPTAQDISLYVVEWSPNGEMIAQGFSDGTVQIVATRTNTIISEFKVNDTGVSVIAWSPTNDEIATGGVYDSIVKIWDISSSQIRATIPDTNGNQLFALVWSPDGQYIFVSRHTGENNISVWDSNSLEFIYGEQVITVTDIEWSPDNQRIALSHFAPHISIWMPKPLKKQLFSEIQLNLSVSNEILVKITVFLILNGVQMVNILSLEQYKVLLKFGLLSITK